MWRCGGDDGGMAVVCFLVFLLHSRMLSRVYLPTRSLVTKGQHTLAGHWLFPPSSSFPFTGEGPSLALCVLSLSVSFPLPPFFFLSLSRRRGSPVFHINTQIPWYRLGPARVYTGTTAAFHDTRPLSPPSSLHLCLSAASPSFRPPYPPVSPPTLPRAAGEAHLRDSLPLVALERPPRLALSPRVASPVPHAFDRTGNLRFPFHRALSSRPSYTAPPDAFADRLYLSHPAPRQGLLPRSPL